MPKLTKRTIDNAEIKDKEYFIFDSELSGFGVRIMSSGRKFYMLQCKCAYVIYFQEDIL